MKSFYFAVSIVLCFIGIMYMCRNMKVNHEAQINGDLERINTDKYKFEVDLDKSIANLSVKKDYNPETPIESEYQYYVDGIQMPDVFNENVNSKSIDKNKYNIEYDFSGHIVRLTSIGQSDEEPDDAEIIYEELENKKSTDEKIVYEEIKVNPNGYQVNGYHSGNNI